MRWIVAGVLVFAAYAGGYLQGANSKQPYINSLGSLNSQYSQELSKRPVIYQQAPITPPSTPTQAPTAPLPIFKCPVTTCNDGSCSSSVGRGTCSWHGGVRSYN